MLTNTHMQTHTLKIGSGSRTCVVEWLTRTPRNVFYWGERKSCIKCSIITVHFAKSRMMHAGEWQVLRSSNQALAHTDMELIPHFSLLVHITGRMVRCAREWLPWQPRNNHQRKQHCIQCNTFVLSPGIMESDGMCSLDGLKPVTEGDRIHPVLYSCCSLSLMRFMQEGSCPDRPEPVTKRDRAIFSVLHLLVTPWGAW